jgi:hypothetical protein
MHAARCCHLRSSKHVNVKAALLRAHRTQHVSINRHFFDLPDASRYQRRGVPAGVRAFILNPC